MNTLLCCVEYRGLWKAKHQAAAVNLRRISKLILKSLKQPFHLVSKPIKQKQQKARKSLSPNTFKTTYANNGVFFSLLMSASATIYIFFKEHDNEYIL